MPKIAKCADTYGVVQVRLAMFVAADSAAATARPSHSSDRPRRTRSLGTSVGRCDGASLMPNLVDTLFKRDDVRGGHVNGLNPRGVPENKSQVLRPHHVLHEKVRGVGLPIQDPGHVGAGI